MSGRFFSIIKFPFYYEGCRRSWLQIEPLATIYGFGIIIKIIVELTGGTDKRRFYYERTIEEFCLTQENIIDHPLAESFSEFLEALYFNKTTQDVAIPVAAMFLKIHVPELLERYNINLSYYVTDVDIQDKSVGFNKGN